MAEVQLLRETSACCCLQLASSTKKRGLPLHYRRHYRTECARKSSNENILYCSIRVFSHREKEITENFPLSSSSEILQFFFIGPQGLLRATGRTKKLDVSSFDAEHPILLDSHYPVTRLFLKNIHRTHCQKGVDYLRALVQQLFAIVTLRTAPRTIVLRCVTCRKRRSETLNPMMTDLPRERLAFKEPPSLTLALTTSVRSTFPLIGRQKNDGDCCLLAWLQERPISKSCRQWTLAAL